MTQQKDEKALIAILAKTLAPEAGGAPSKRDLAAADEGSSRLSDAERRMIDAMDPLESIRRKTPRGKLIEFPQPEDDLPLAVGYNRGKKDEDYSESTSKRIAEKRKEVIERIKQRRGREPETGDSE